MTNYIPLWTLFRREVSRFLRVWSQSLIPPMLTATLYILIFGYSLGSQISDISGVTYLEFIIPGLLMMAVIMSSYMNTSFSLYVSRFQGNIQELLVAPISYWHMIWAYTLAALARAVVVGSGVLIVSLFFTDLQVHNYFILFYFMVVTAILFAFAGLLTAMWATSFDKVSVFSTFLITPLIYLGGVFYSIKMLPPFWIEVSKYNPILYMVDGFRYGFLGISDTNLYFSMTLVAVLTIIACAVTVHLFKKGFRLRT